MSSIDKTSDYCKWTVYLQIRTGSKIVEWVVFRDINSVKKSVFTKKPHPKSRPHKITIIKVSTTLAKAMNLLKIDKSVLIFIKDWPKIVMLVIKYSSKIHKPTLYKKAINDPVYSRRW